MLRTASLCLLLSIAGVAANVGSAETIRVLALSSEAFFYDDDGSHAGIEYEILSFYAKNHNLDLEIEYANSFAEILDRVEKGEFDIGSGTITMTAERETRMEFSAPYFPVQVVLVERKGETSASLADLAGSKVAAFARTTAEDELLEIEGVEVVQRSGIDGMFQAVLNGEIRAAAADSSAVIPVMDDYPGLEISLTFGEPSSFGFALPKGSPHKKPLSDHITGLKTSGIYFRLVTKYMGEKGSEVVRASRTP